jgi:hypothetical protein
MDKLDFMNVVKDTLEEVSDENIIARGNEMKSIIDRMVESELNFAKAGIR